MESVAVAQTRLHFQSFDMTAGLHDRKTKARLVHTFYRSSGVVRITKNGVSKKISNFPEIYCFVSKKKVIATGLHALAHIMGSANNCCCTADAYHAWLVHLYAWFFLLHGQDLVKECR